MNITSYLKKISFLFCLIMNCFFSLVTIPGFADTAINNQQHPGGKINDSRSIKEYGYEVVNVYPHDHGAFTQGLIFKDGLLYESTGRFGKSSLREIELQTGKVIKKYLLADEIFAEGLTANGNQLVQLTWKAGRGFIYNADYFIHEGSFQYPGEGWGLTYYDGHYIMSDGTSALRFLDPKTMQEVGRLQVTRAGQPLRKINELEMVKGKIYANVWHSDYIVIINPESGVVEGQINLAGLLREYAPGVRADVLNGIAYDESGERLFVTGKLWPKLFEIRLVPSAAN